MCKGQAQQARPQGAMSITALSVGGLILGIETCGRRGKGVIAAAWTFCAPGGHV